MVEQEIPIHILHSNNNSTAIHRQKCLWGSFRNQVEGYKTPVEPKTEQGHFEKAGPHQVAGSPTVVPATGTEAALSHPGLGYSRVWPCSCYRHHPPGNLEGVTPDYASRNRPANFDLTVDIEAALYLSSNPLPAMAQEQSSQSKDPPGETLSVHPEAGLPNLVQLQILKYPCNSAPAPPSCGLGNGLSTQGLSILVLGGRPTTSNQLRILKWHCNSATVPLSCSPGAALITQGRTQCPSRSSTKGPGRSQTHLHTW